MDLLGSQAIEWKETLWYFYHWFTDTNRTTWYMKNANTTDTNNTTKTLILLIPLLFKCHYWPVSGIEFIHEEISWLFCSEKFYDGGGWHCNYSYKLQVQVSVRLEINIAIEIFRVHMEMTWTRAWQYPLNSWM